MNNGKGRGGQYGMHGFIAEVAECGIGNAREQIEGKALIYEWINDNGGVYQIPEDHYSLDKVEPSKLKYSEVQKGTYEQTFSKEKGNCSVPSQLRTLNNFLKLSKE